MAAGGGGSGVLYKRIPPPEPKYDGPRFRTSPSYEQECYPHLRNGGMDDYIPTPAGKGNSHRGLSSDDYHDYRARNPDNVPTYNIDAAFDAMYDDDDDDDDDCGLTPADLQRQTNEYITAALHYYNSQDQNQVKYELVRPIYTSTAIMDSRGFYGHVNFTAKSSLENSKEELLFAEVYYNRGSKTCIPTCIVSLEGQNGVGGVRGKDICGPYRGMKIRLDTQHCYACLDAVKHPEDGTLYETGHHVDGCYGYL